MSRTHAHACIIAPCSSRGCADVAIHHRAYAAPYDKPFLKVFKGGGISLKGQQSQLLCSSPLTLENNEIFKKSNQTIPRYTHVTCYASKKNTKMKKERKNSEMEETILFFRANEPLSRSEDARFERRIYGGHVPAHVTRLRAMNSSLASLSASRFDCASACPTRAPHTLAPSCVSLKDASVRSEPRGGFRLIVRPILLHPLVLIHRIVKWRWPNLLLYRIMVILRGQRWERCDRMRDSPILPLFSIVFWMKILRYISR